MRSCPAATGSTCSTSCQADAIRADDRSRGQAGHRGLLLGSKVSDEVAQAHATCPQAWISGSPCRHPDFLGPDDMVDQDRGAPRGHSTGGS